MNQAEYKLQKGNDSLKLKAEVVYNMLFFLFSYRIGCYIKDKDNYIASTSHYSSFYFCYWDVMFSSCVLANYYS